MVIHDHYENKGHGFIKVKQCTYKQSTLNKIVNHINNFRQTPRKIIRSFTDAKKRASSLTTTTAYRLEDWTDIYYDQYSDGSIQATADFDWLGFMVHYITVRELNSKNIPNDHGMTFNEFVDLCVITNKIASNVELQHSSQSLQIGDSIHIYINWNNANETTINEYISNNTSLKMAFESVSYDSIANIE